MTDIISIPKEVRSVLARLDAYGYRSYVVGGCVRDSLMGRTPKDWDICTPALPHKVKALFPHTVDTGIKHGTVSVVGSEGVYEVTTFRVDTEYTDGRHPDAVRFTGSVVQDLARRDFTINAIAFHPVTGFIDPFGGREDVRRGVIRCVGDPKERFAEDALRLLRALRFSSVLGFGIEGETRETILKLAQSNVDPLRNVSKERQRDELVKLLMGKNAVEVLREYVSVVEWVLPELRPCVGLWQDNPYHCYDVYEHILHALDAYEGDDIKVKLALLLHDIGKPATKSYSNDGSAFDDGFAHYYGHHIKGSDMAKEALTRLHFDNETIRDVTELVLHHDTRFAPSEKAVKRVMRNLGVEQTKRLLDVRFADVAAHTPHSQTRILADLEYAAKAVDDIIAKEECFTLKSLAINGLDILAFGIPPSPQVGEILEACLNAVMDGSIPNDRDTLLTHAQSLLPITPDDMDER